MDGALWENFSVIFVYIARLLAGVRADRLTRPILQGRNTLRRIAVPVGRPQTRVLLLTIPLLMFTLCDTRAFAAATYVSARGLAQAHGMEYRDLSDGTVHACKLVGKGHEILLSADVRHVLVNGSVAVLTRPVRWDGKSLLVPAEAKELLSDELGESSSPAPAPAPAPALAPVPAVAEVEPFRASFKVVIDAGHGGRDPGAVRSGLKEKDINLDIARRLAARLRASGVTVVLTRDKDVAVSLSNRVAIANREQPDLFLSIHANTEPKNSVRGAMTLFPDDIGSNGGPSLFERAKEAVKTGSLRVEKLGAGGPVGKSALLAVAGATFESHRVRSIQAASVIQDALEPVTGTVRRANGVIEDWRELRVLRLIQAPRVLVEVDFLSHPTSRRKLARSAHRAAIAEAISGAVVKFLRNGESGEERL